MKLSLMNLDTERKQEACMLTFLPVNLSVNPDQLLAVVLSDVNL